MTETLCGEALALQPRAEGGGGSGKSEEQVLEEMCNAFVSELPDDFDLELAIYKRPIIREEVMNTVINQEILRFNRLTSYIRFSLREIAKAVKGLAVMTPDLEAISSAMVDGLVPAQWLKTSYPSKKKLAFYYKNLIKRLKFMQDWIDNGAQPICWISGLYFIQAYLTGLTQNFARKYNTPIDTLIFDFAFPEKDYEPTARPEDGGYINGIYTDGAKWDADKRVVADSEFGVLYYEMTIIHVIPVDITNKVEKHTYKCPFYRTSERKGVLNTSGQSSNFIMTMEIPLEKNSKEDYWIKRGMCLLTALDHN